MRLNDVETEDSRYNPFAGEEKYSFLDVTVGPGFIGRKMIDSGNTTYQNGPIKIIERHIILGTFHFISNERILHQRQVYTILNMLGDFGGLEGILLSMACAFCYNINKYHINLCLLK